ncbi:MAG TPA: hypothetical protein VEC06_15095 [Paucimonas sp.]|nr:hypothetical protein [Paucimonas sp.]
MNKVLDVTPSSEAYAEATQEAEQADWLSVSLYDYYDADDPELRITCRTKSALAAVPDIISMVPPLLVIDGQTLEVNFTINANHRFFPGSAPQSCGVSVDDIQWLPTRSSNLFQVDFPNKAELAVQNMLRARLKFERFGIPIVFAFRLKYREGPMTPRQAKKVVLLATIMPNSRDVALTKG